ncbi:MAG: serine hydrolase [Thermomicrobiales bacterium]|nr:serine hydrolase [Thermomicrobiales bacterium]MCO5223408.1 beta-lactamase family protein [Thermomicrobiales bacterium]
MRPVSISRRSFVAGLGALALCGTSRAGAQSLAPIPDPDWTLVAPAEVGLAETQLIAAGDFAAVNMPDITGIVVVRNNGLAYERYFGNEYGIDDPLNVRSITKCVTGTLTGMAIDDGLLSLSSTIGETIPDLIPPNADPRTASITIDNLLTMSAGWAWDIHADWGTLTASPNWTELTLGLPVIYEPGTFYAYNTGGSHLLGVITQNVVGQDLADYADDRLWSPLGIEKPVWRRSPEGVVSGGAGVELTPRDTAKFGLLSLRNGQWGDRSLISESWFPEATRFHIQGDTTGYAGYGYQWWVIDYENGFHAYFGLGFGSNYLYVVPALDLVIVVLKGFETPPTPISIVRPFIEEWILPAVIA